MKTVICIIFILIGIESFSQTELIFYTNYGQFVVVMEDSLAPITSGNFIKLADEKYYDGVLFHRVIDGFMIQGGDPNGDGTGGPGYTIQDEFHVSLSNVQGTLSMANSGPNTGGSQFFINLVNNTYLDFNKPPFTSKHAVFGHVIQGFELVQLIGKVQTDDSDRPLEEVRMDSVRVIRDPTEDQNKLSGQTLFPNPVQAISQLSFTSTDTAAITLHCYDAYGSLVWSRQVEVFPGMQTIALNDLYQKLPNRGMYFLRIDDGASLRFVKTE